jgi:predicted unusual protein kinase regulating ubiquinone biosynthesis (AarF/ABC1/UbiB family)
MSKTRYRRIVFFFARTLISLAIWEIIFPAIGLHNRSQRTRSERLSQVARNYRLLAIHLGGVLIKVGQFLSARVDVLPVEVTNELSGLQDEVPPEDFSAIRQVIEAEFGMPLEDKFASFVVDPHASASLGQVHRAEVDGQSVMVKVQRPDIELILATDLAALRTVGGWLQHYRPISRRANVPALIEEFTRTLYEEIDYLAEGRNAETFAANFKQRPGVHVPAVIWTHTTRRVLTLEDVGAIKITDFEAITAAGIDRAEVADRLFDVYLKQIFEDSFFHADPHPGNLFVAPLSGPGETTPDSQSNAGAWELIFVDFGMVGRVPANLRAGMREMVIAMGTRDTARTIKAFQLMGVLLPGADLELLEKAEAAAFEYIWGKSMRELQEFDPQELRQFVLQFRELLYDMPFQVPEDMILLGRCVGILSGLCTGLNPEFNVWKGVVPYAETLIQQEAGPQWQIWMGELGNLARILLGFPKRIDVVLGKMERGELSVREPQLVAQVSRLERTISRLAGSLIFAVLMLGGIQLYLAGRDVFSAVLLAGAGLSLGWMLLSALRRR